MPISAAVKSRIVTLHEHTTTKQVDIAKLCKVSQSAVSKILKQFRLTGSLEAKSSVQRGRRRKTSNRTDRILLMKSKIDARLTSEDLRRELVNHGANVSARTVRRRLQEFHRPARRPVKRQKLTPRMKKARMEWARNHQDWTVEDWKKVSSGTVKIACFVIDLNNLSFQVIFSDESHFEVQSRRTQYVRRSVGEPIRLQHVEEHVKHPDKIMYWGCFSAGGVGPLVPVDGMMNGKKYVGILRKNAVPELSKRFPDKSGIFQQDLAPCHTSKLVQSFFSSKNITVLQWPGNSPDLNPIENLWAIVRARLRTKDRSTKASLMASISEVWVENDSELTKICSNLVESMPRRVKMCLKSRGGHTKY